MAGVRIKGAQVKPGLTKAAQNATTVHVSEDIAENDILCVIGMSGSFMSVAKADYSNKSHTGPFYVANYAASADYIGPVAVDEKIVTANTSVASGVLGSAVLLGDTAGKLRGNYGTGGWASATGNAAVRGGPKIGTVIKVGDADNGKVLLRPSDADTSWEGIITASSGTTLTATGFTASHTQATISTQFKTNNGGRHVLSAVISAGTLTITLNGALTGASTLWYKVSV